MDRQSKVWGERWLIRQDSTHAVSFLKIYKGHRCSWHRHDKKFNLFVVIWGKIGIMTQDLGGIVREVILTEGQSFVTRPDQLHEFRAYEDSAVIEEMYVQYEEDDIERVTSGGVFDLKEGHRG